MAASLSRRISLMIINGHKSRCKILHRSPQNENFYRHSKVGFAKSAVQTKSENSSQDLILSDSCIEQIHKIGEQNNCLRVVVDGGGCSGYQYSFEIVNKPKDGDRVFEKDGCRVVVDPESLEFIKGSTIDFHEELIRSSFRVIDNPLAEKGCSCGASFSIKI